VADESREFNKRDQSRDRGVQNRELNPRDQSSEGGVKFRNSKEEGITMESN